MTKQELVVGSEVTIKRYDGTERIVVRRFEEQHGDLIVIYSCWIKTRQCFAKKTTCSALKDLTLAD